MACRRIFANPLEMAPTKPSKPHPRRAAAWMRATRGVHAFEVGGLLQAPVKLGCPPRTTRLSQCRLGTDTDIVLGARSRYPSRHGRARCAWRRQPRCHWCPQARPQANAPGGASRFGRPLAIRVIVRRRLSPGHRIQGEHRDRRWAGALLQWCAPTPAAAVRSGVRTPGSRRRFPTRSLKIIPRCPRCPCPCGI